MIIAAKKNGHRDLPAREDLSHFDAGPEVLADSRAGIPQSPQVDDPLHALEFGGPGHVFRPFPVGIGEVLLPGIHGVDQVVDG
jgi:hypothetical protein